MRPASPFELANHDVFVITSAHQGREGGQVATWVMPGSLIPDQPRVVAVLSPMNATYELIRDSRRFALSLLADEQLSLLPHFGLTSGRDIDKLDGVAIRRTKSGLAVLEGCCGFAECQVAHALDIGDRVVCVADVVEQEVDPDRRPLRTRQAFERLPAEVVAALREKYLRDGERDRQLRR